MVQDLDIGISDEVDVKPPVTRVDAAEWVFRGDYNRAYPANYKREGGGVPSFMPVFGICRKPVLSCGSI